MAATLSPLKVGHIHDVQELTKAKQVVIPERFIRDLPDSNNFNLPPSTTIPVIDLSKLVNCDKAEFQSEISKLASACEEWGFFQVINHGIDGDLLKRTEDLTMEFFMLPVEEKQKYPMIPGTVQGYGQAFVFSEEQKLDWCNMFALGMEPDSIKMPHLWPSKPPMFCDTLVEYSKGVRRLCQKLLGFIATALELKEDRIEEMFGVAVQAVRTNYYPPCPRPDLVMGLSPHSDGSALTVLQQRGDTVGLHILKDNEWVPVQPLPNALVINVGDSIEVLTNGKYKSVEHRAVAHKEKDRLTLVTFYAPSYAVEIGPMPEFVNESNPCKYRRYNHGEYAKHYVTSKLQGKKTLDFAKIHDTKDSE